MKPPGALERNITAYLSQLGSKGGKAAAAKLTSKERTERARKAARARWDQIKKQLDSKPG